ncbi:MAG TPA: antibiotic biosynthesis monooxygenase [Kofleriaceae bacterium]|nr:antibiotic biosynthesis monooxygenase [Kofleriaceae bacterium]
MGVTEHAEGVTVVVVRTVKPGREQDAEAWMHGVSEVATKFAGHLGITIFRPRPGGRDFTFIFRFDTPHNLERWEKSPERDEWVHRAEAFTERVHVYKHTGLETWFASPDAPIAVPPRWKMVVVTWAVAFPLIQLLTATLGRALSDVPALPRGAVFGLAMVLIMTYLAMPFVTKALRRWLYPPPPT